MKWRRFGYVGNSAPALGSPEQEGRSRKAVAILEFAAWLLFRVLLLSEPNFCALELLLDAGYVIVFNVGRQ